MDRIAWDERSGATASVSMIVRFSDASLADLDNIFKYIAADSMPQAVVMLDRLGAAAAGLTDFPSLGRAGTLVGTRELVTVKPYVIVYRLASGIIEIGRVYHGAQNR